MPSVVLISTIKSAILQAHDKADSTKRYCEHFPRIKDLRIDKDLRQRDAAEVLGINQTVYSGYERGFQAIPVGHLVDKGKPAMIFIKGIRAEY